LRALFIVSSITYLFQTSVVYVLNNLSTLSLTTDDCDCQYSHDCCCLAY